MTGYFIDWDGLVRSTNNPGNGYACGNIINEDVDDMCWVSMDVIDSMGETIFTAVLYETYDAIKNDIGHCPRDAII